MLLDKYSGRMTYRDMAYLILEHFTDEQKNMDVTAADPLSSISNIECGDFGGLALNLVQPTAEECYVLGLDEAHPVFIALEIGE